MTDRTAQSDGRSGGGMRRLAVRVALVLGSLVLSLAAAELAARALGLQVPPRGDTGMQGIVRNVPEDEVPGVEFLLVPGLERSTAYPGAPGEPPRPVTYAINALGFRGPETTVAKPDGVLRLAILGDSFTYGTGADQDETWPGYLQERLDALLGAGRVEVLNWAVPAYNARQQVALLDRWAADFDPDLVVVCAYINDASGEARGAGGDRTERATPWEVRWIARLGLTSGRLDRGARKTPAQARATMLRERSRLIDVLAWRAHGWLIGRVTVRNYVDDWSEGSPGLAMVEEALTRARAIAEREGLDLHATMYPDLTGLDGGYPFAEQHATFERLCAERGIPFHDVLPALAGEDPTQLRAHEHDKHPNAAANRRVAAHLAELLLPHLHGG